MGYRAELEEAARWLVSIQRPDHGWGLTAGQASSIVNTAEALYVLRCSRRFEAAQERAVDFINSNLFKHLETLGPRIRYVAFALFAMSVIDESRRSRDLIGRAKSWLLDAKNEDGAWGTEAGDNASTLFSTFLALWSLQRVHCDERDLLSGYQWFLAHSSDRGWALGPDMPASAVATAYAVI